MIAEVIQMKIEDILKSKVGHKNVRLTRLEIINEIFDMLRIQLSKENVLEILTITCNEVDKNEISSFVEFVGSNGVIHKLTTNIKLQ